MEEKQKELNDKVVRLLDMLEKYSKIIISDNVNEKKMGYQLVLQRLQETVPGIVDTYSRLDPQDTYGNRSYWTNQVRRIVAVMEETDVFAQLDALYFETYKNLLKFHEMISQEDSANE